MGFEPPTPLRASGLGKYRHNRQLDSFGLIHLLTGLYLLPLLLVPARLTAEVDNPTGTLKEVQGVLNRGYVPLYTHPGQMTASLLPS